MAHNEYLIKEALEEYHWHHAEMEKAKRKAQELEKEGAQLRNQLEEARAEQEEAAWPKGKAKEPTALLEQQQRA